MTTTNRLYYGDNLYILRNHDYFPNECVDLIYLDPPFNSNRNYNVLFKDESGRDSDAQITAFEDTWHWGQEAENTFHELVTDAPAAVSVAIDALRKIVGRNQMMAYLVMMTARLVELHRVLKPTGSLYLHCDPTASHYLKIILDTIFGAEQFRNEIIWKRSHPHGNVSRSYGSIHDVIFFYSKSDNYTWNTVYRPYFLENGELDPELAETVLKQYRMVDKDTGRLFQATSLLNPNPDRPNLTYEFHGHLKVWRWTQERMKKAESEGRLYLPKEGKGIPREKRFLDEQKGIPAQDIWNDINPLMGSSAERLGYPTQKPIALLERIIQASSNLGDVVLDPFCGCGTAIAAAQKLERQWIGIDITHLSIALQRYRLKDMFPDATLEVIGEPTSIGSARQLAEDDRHQFEWWALSLIEAKPIGGTAGSRKGKKGSDRGIDGVISFLDFGGKSERVVVQVKSGKVKVGDIRDLVGTVDREKAAIGVFLTLEAPTSHMTREAVSAGFFTSKMGERFPKIQILTIEDIFNGKRVEMPRLQMTFKRADQVKKGADAEQKKLL